MLNISAEIEIMKKMFAPGIFLYAHWYCSMNTLSTALFNKEKAIVSSDKKEFE
jgi:hypothetical protein